MVSIIKIIANNPASIMIAGGVILALAGNNFGELMILLGFALQIIWIFKDKF